VKILRFWLVPPEDLKQKSLEFIIIEGYFNPITFSELDLHIERSPPCIKKAYKLGRFRVVKSYFNLLGFLPDTRKENHMIKCNYMRKQKLCEPDNLCKNIESGNLTEYYNVRLKRKITKI
jgi:hypothetical protein